jgi:hypothetical protein
VAVRVAAGLAAIDEHAARDIVGAALRAARAEQGFLAALALIELSRSDLLDGSALREEAAAIPFDLNSYYLAYLLRDLFVACLARDPSQAPDILGRAIERGWTTTMAALEAGALSLVERCGPDVAGALLGTIQAAWLTLAGPSGEALPGHLDGVATAPALRPPWAAAGD